MPLRLWAARLRHRVRSLIGRDLVLPREIDVDIELLGSEYGGFAIVRGSLNQDSVVLSCGIGEDASFDLAVIEKYGCRVQAYAPTPQSVDWVRSNIHDDRFVFHECAVGAMDGPLRLYLPRNPNHVSASIKAGQHTSAEFIDVPCKRLATILADLKVAKVDVLKMDIEGAEYGVVADFFGTASRILPAQIAIEFHHYQRAFGVSATRAALELLHQADYRIAWRSVSHREVLLVKS